LSMTTAVETMQDTPFTIGGRSFHSRLMVGTGKYRDNDTMARAIDASGAEIVTVAVRRVDLDRTKEEGVLYHLDAKRYFLLANTAGCYTAEDAVRYARLAREAGFNEFIKLEVIGDQETLLPDVQTRGGDAVLAARRDAGLGAPLPPGARHCRCSTQCAGVPPSRAPAMGRSPTWSSVTADSRTSSRPACCGAAPSSIGCSSSRPPILASTTCSGSGPTSSVRWRACRPTRRCR